jgi:hypothetical protein
MILRDLNKMEDVQISDADEQSVASAPGRGNNRDGSFRSASSFSHEGG